MGTLKRGRGGNPDAESAARVIARLREEAEHRRGTPQGDVWRDLAELLGRRWPQGLRPAGDREEDR